MTHRDLKTYRRYGPRVHLIDSRGCAAVEKTFRDAPLPVRLLGLVLVSWESFIYSRLSGIEGIPELLPSPDRLTLTTRFMGGTNLKETSLTPNARYFEELGELIHAMHQRGVIHLDLRNRRNYGLDDKGRPYLVDFATCLYIPWVPGLRRALATIDWMGLAKIKNRLNPELLEDREKRLLALGTRLSSWWLPARAVRGIRRLVGKAGRP
jgi:serine/threonine protein kinase